MVGELKRLLEPGRIGKLNLKNRVVYPPMGTRLFTEEGEVSDRLIDYYLERARGGIGLIVFEATYVRAGGYRGRVCLDDDRFIPDLRRLTDAIHREGARMVCQVNVHRGRADEHDPASPSNIPHPYTKVVPRPLSIDDLERLKADFGLGARRVKEAGFDGMMIHGGSGYLLAEFLSPVTNKRTDEYGGDIQGRARFPLELVETARKSVGPDFPIIYRLIADDRIEGGYGIEDAIEVAKMLEKAGIDAIDVVSGFAETDEWTAPLMYLPPACNTDHSAAIKKNIGVPVMVAGKINDPFLAEQILASGKADFVDMGRAFLADPQILKKAIEGRAEDIRKCIGCLRCSEAIIQSHSPIQCALNPAVGKEREFESRLRLAEKKNVLVLGGGPAGMEAAIIAARKGHQVTLWEAGEALGGELNLAVLPPGKGDLDNLLSYLKTQVYKSGVKVELGKDVDEKSVTEFGPEALIVAVGTTPFTPDIPGVEGKHVVTYKQVLAGEVEAGKKVVIIGGGLIGCEAADFLAERGKEVTMAFFEPEPLIVFSRVRRYVVKMLKKKNVRILTDVKEFKQIAPNGIELVDREGKTVFLEADTVVLATGVRSNRTLAESLQVKVPELYEAGDCIEPRRILEAIHEGAEAALRI